MLPDKIMPGTIALMETQKANGHPTKGWILIKDDENQLGSFQQLTSPSVPRLLLCFCVRLALHPIRTDHSVPLTRAWVPIQNHFELVTFKASSLAAWPFPLRQGHRLRIFLWNEWVLIPPLLVSVHFGYHWVGVQIYFGSSS